MYICFLVQRLSNPENIRSCATTLFPLRGTLSVQSYSKQLFFSSLVTHSLRYLHSASSGIPGFPGFVTVVLVDGQPFSYYDSNIRRELPRQSWMVQTENPDFWERRTQSSFVNEQVFKRKVAMIKPRFNHTGGELGLFSKCV